MKEIIVKFDSAARDFFGKINAPFSRFALFVVYFWFGILKIFGTSPANPMVQSLLERTLPFITFNQFIIVFALYEMAIGMAFLIPRLEKLALLLILPHMVMTSLPLVFLSGLTWQGFFVPTMEGQYIIKNLVILALAISIVARVAPLEIKK